MQSVQSSSELFGAASSSNRSHSGGPADLGQEDFLTLLVTQLKNQNPTQPTDNMEFISQIAQFGTVTGIQDLQESFGNFASVMFGSQGLQAAGLVGKQVLSSSHIGALVEEGGIDGSVDVPQSVNDLTLYIHDGNSGALVRTLQLGVAAAGDFQFQWDGSGADGEPLPPGNYVFAADALIQGQRQALDAQVQNRVDSVTVDRNTANIYLNLDNGGQINIAQVEGFK